MQIQRDLGRGEVLNCHPAVQLGFPHPGFELADLDGSVVRPIGDMLGQPAIQGSFVKA